MPCQILINSAEPAATGAENPSTHAILIKENPGRWDVMYSHLVEKPFLAVGYCMPQIRSNLRLSYVQWIREGK